jgi:hypothetical protein
MLPAALRDLCPHGTLAALKYIYDHFYIYGWDPGKGEMPVWNNTYGFLNCINKGRPWNSAKSNHFHGINAAIDYGPNVLMLENYKLGATWRWFMQNTNISAGIPRSDSVRPSSLDRDVQQPGQPVRRQPRHLGRSRQHVGRNPHFQ